jgi:hypothetical protein
MGLPESDWIASKDLGLAPLSKDHDSRLFESSWWPQS